MQRKLEIQEIEFLLQEEPRTYVRPQNRPKVENASSKTLAGVSVDEPTATRPRSAMHPEKLLHSRNSPVPAARPLTKRETELIVGCELSPIRGSVVIRYGTGKPLEPSPELIVAEESYGQSLLDLLGESKRTKKQCKACGKEFFALRGNHIYCTPKCRNSAKRIEKIKKLTRTCSWCGEAFPVEKRADSEFCSDKCKMRHFRQKNRSGIRG